MSMEIDIYQKESDDQYVDWKGRKANPKIHGGIRAAAFACGKLQLIAHILTILYICAILRNLS